MTGWGATRQDSGVWSLGGLTFQCRAGIQAMNRSQGSCPCSSLVQEVRIGKDNADHVYPGLVNPMTADDQQGRFVCTKK